MDVKHTPHLFETAMPSLRRPRASSGYVGWVLASLAVGTGAFGVAPRPRAGIFGGRGRLHHSSRSSAVSRVSIFVGCLATLACGATLALHCGRSRARSSAPRVTAGILAFFFYLLGWFIARIECVFAVDCVLFAARESMCTCISVVLLCREIASPIHKIRRLTSTTIATSSNTATATEQQYR